MSDGLTPPLPSRRRRRGPPNKPQATSIRAAPPAYGCRADVQSPEGRGRRLEYVDDDKVFNMMGATAAGLLKAAEKGYLTKCLSTRSSSRHASATRPPRLVELTPPPGVRSRPCSGGAIGSAGAVRPTLEEMLSARGCRREPENIYHVIPRPAQRSRAPVAEEGVLLQGDRAGRVRAVYGRGHHDEERAAGGRGQPSRLNRPHARPPRPRPSCASVASSTPRTASRSPARGPCTSSVRWTTRTSSPIWQASRRERQRRRSVHIMAAAQGRGPPRWRRAGQLPPPGRSSGRGKGLCHGCQVRDPRPHPRRASRRCARTRKSVAGQAAIVGGCGRGAPGAGAPCGRRRRRASRARRRAAPVQDSDASSDEPTSSSSSDAPPSSSASADIDATPKEQCTSKRGFKKSGRKGKHKARVRRG